MRFREDGTFHILQLADIQEIPEVSEDTLELIRRALDLARPDLVILSGDQLKGYSRTFRKEGPQKAEKTLRTVLEPLVSRGIPFAVTFGNHDRQCGMSNEEQMAIYRSMPGCIDWLSPRGHDILHGPEEGTFAIGIESADQSRTAMAVYLMDTHGDAAGGGYETLHPGQLYWFKGARDTFAQLNAKAVPGIVFQHIPMPEYYRLLKRVDQKTPDAVRAYRTHAREYYILDDLKCRPDGVLREAVSIPDHNAREFEVLKEQGDIFAVYCGHDHRNTFVGNCSGIDLGYTPACGFNDYGDGVNRAVREFVFYEDNPSQYETRLLTYRELVGKKPKRRIRDKFYSMVPASADEAKALGKKGLLLTGLLLVAARVICLLIKNMKDGKGR